MYEKFIIGVGILLEKSGKILIAKRAEDKDIGAGLWEVPSGRVEVGETLEECISREANEELQISITDVTLIDAYTFMRGDNPCALLTYRCNYVGEIKKSHEHSEFKWVSPKEAMKLFSFENQKSTIRRFMEMSN